MPAISPQKQDFPSKNGNPSSDALPPQADDGDALPEFWSVPLEKLYLQLGTSGAGLGSKEAASRLQRRGNNRLDRRGDRSSILLLLAQFKSPIIIILVLAACLSFWLGQHSDSMTILFIVTASGLLGFWQERGAAGAVAKLLALVQIKVSVLRDGVVQILPSAQIVPGDVVLLSAGAQIPGDGVLIEANHCYINEASLTGESYPAEKLPGSTLANAALHERPNMVFMGTHVVSGEARALIVKTAGDTELGQVSQRLRLTPPETEFERGIREFGNMLLEITLTLVIIIFAVNVFLHRPILDSFLFSLALAVGLMPQLLPAIVSINLASGARRMAESKVIVKRLTAIENLGSMDVLCSDKTGTLTEGKVCLHKAVDVEGNVCDAVFLLAYLNAKFETGFVNPIDEAIRNHVPKDLSAYTKVGEMPYDFIRKRLSILVQDESGHVLLTTKGALTNVLEICTTAQTLGGLVPLDSVRSGIEDSFAAWSRQGLRVLGVARRDFTSEEMNIPLRLDKEAETGLTFCGFILLLDPPKRHVQDTIAQLRNLGITLKIITGDNLLVAESLGRALQLESANILTGSQLRHMSNAALVNRVRGTHIFAEIEPNQKETLILAMRRAGYVVGYLGDGINDASALHVADAGISVEGAVDVAREAADIILLEKDLGVLVEGVKEGRKTFANTLKYVFMATSANFGNMFSMAGASLFLPFLPLLPKQILLTNLLTDFPEMTIATDTVDPEAVQRPRRWDIKFIRRFMLTFGLLSSIFDYLTFAMLRLVLKAGPAEFRTGWLVESVVSATLIVLVIRTSKFSFRSRPSVYLQQTTFAILAFVLCLPYLPIGQIFGLVPLPPQFLAALAVIVACYVAAAEIAKFFFYKFNTN